MAVGTQLERRQEVELGEVQDVASEGLPVPVVVEMEEAGGVKVSPGVVALKELIDGATGGSAADV